MREGNLAVDIGNFPGCKRAALVAKNGQNVLLCGNTIRAKKMHKSKPKRIASADLCTNGPYCEAAEIFNTIYDSCFLRNCKSLILLGFYFALQMVNVLKAQ